MADGNHAHHHGHAAAGNRRRLLLVLVLTAGYLIAEVIGGLATNSLALLSDAGHMLTDVAALALALVALWFATRPPDPRRTYGYYRVEILAALFNGMTLLAITVYIVIEAARRIQQPPPVGGLGLLVIASGGLVVNLIGAYLLHRGHQHSLNVRAAFYHLLGDALGSLGAILAGVFIYFFGWQIADPILAIGIAVLIVISAVGLVREAVDVLLEAVPKHVDVDQVRAVLLDLPGVLGVHDLHVWTLTSGMYALSCHVVVGCEDFACVKLETIRNLLHDRFDIPHMTVQLETEELAAEEDIHL
ncbi:MAG: cation diffusion facilitator family transporter [Armatimonadota bacterium]